MTLSLHYGIGGVKLVWVKFDLECLCSNKNMTNKTITTAAGTITIIIIMYIYHALINALSAHMIHIDLKMYTCRA